MSEPGIHTASIDTLPRELPIFPLPGALLLPYGELPLNIFEPRYVRMLKDVLAGDRLIGMVQPREFETEADLATAPGDPKLYDIGCAGRVSAFTKTDHGHYQIVLSGICRFSIVCELERDTPYRQVRADYSQFRIDLSEENSVSRDDRERLLETLNDFLVANSIQADWSEINKAPTATLVATMSIIGSFGVREKQALLEADTLADRVKTLITLIEMALASRARPSCQSMQ